MRYSLPPAGYKDGKPFWKVADVLIPPHIGYLAIGYGDWGAIDQSSKKSKNNTF